MSHGFGNAAAAAAAVREMMELLFSNRPKPFVPQSLPPSQLPQKCLAMSKLFLLIRLYCFSFLLEPYDVIAALCKSLLCNDDDGDVDDDDDENVALRFRLLWRPPFVMLKSLSCRRCRRRCRRLFDKDEMVCKLASSFASTNS